MMVSQPSGGTAGVIVGEFGGLQVQTHTDVVLVWISADSLNKTLSLGDSEGSSSSLKPRTKCIDRGRNKKKKPVGL